MDNTNGKQPRIPPEFNGAQFNFCKNASCANFGIPASTEPQPRGRNALKRGADSHYNVVKVTKARLPALKCKHKDCGSVSLIKNNQAIVEEYSRLKDYLISAPIGCTNKDCTNGKEGVHEKNGGYRLAGKTETGSQRYLCKACKTTFSIPTSSTKFHRKFNINVRVFKQLINKSPFRRILNMLDIGPKTLYDKMRFLYWQCRAFSGDKESKLPEMKFDRLYLCTDRQDYMTKWISASRRSMIKYLGITTAEAKSGYIFGDHLNFDTSLTPEMLEAMANECRDEENDPPFRRYARYWQNGDYRIPSFFLQELDEGDKEGEYFGNTRIDRDDPRPADPKKKKKRFKGPTIPISGTKVHNEYTAYGHFMFLRHLLKGAKKLCFYLDGDRPLKPACMSVFCDDIKTKRCDAFRVNIVKGLTMGQKQKLIADAKEYLNLRQEERPDLDLHEVKHLIVKDEVQALIDRGELDGGSIRHPFPDMGEPIKYISYLTLGGPDIPKYSIDHLAWLFYHASLHMPDRFFMLLRRMISTVERPVATPSSKNRKWHGYAPYDPQVIGWLLEIYRTYYNYCFVGEDKMTAAMRLGLAKEPVPMREIVDFYTGNVLGGGTGDRSHHRCYKINPPKKEEEDPSAPRCGRPPGTLAVTSLNETLDIPKAPRVFMDIETDSAFGRTTGIWVIGVFDESTGRFRQFKAETPEKEKKMLLKFTAYCNETRCSAMVAYAGNDFDRDTIIRRMEHHGIVVPEVLKATTDILKPICAVANFYLRGLKPVASRLGYLFKHKGLDGRIAAIEYEDCIRTKKKLPDWLFEYNKDDVMALRYVVRKLEKLPVDVPRNKGEHKKRTKQVAKVSFATSF